ncbi:ATP-dependent DNA helicase pif1-like [Aplysia californica]|uniref:ATP-dependent DNA helicase n=1 Tax=Aplysia californica TaxID=6500 RepID=A0ABM0K7Q3_APLCA|nr:ATP-dependent DNA helicase pif1-like [Aplysia californica]
MFALEARGGTGKTHTINLILAAVRSFKKIALATALSGIAATLLSHGRTLHSRCKIPVRVNEQSMCSVSPQEASGTLLRQTERLIIDEVSMGHKHIFEAIDRTLQDMCENTSLFDGLNVLMPGDWRQVLPVVRHGSRSQIVNARLKSSYLWEHVNVLRLTRSMRVSLTGATADFSNYLLNIGDGKHNICKQIGEFAIKVPDDMTVKSERKLIDFVFGNLQSNTNPDWLASRCIICPTNTEVDRINNLIMQSFPGEEKVYKSCDSVKENEHQHPIKFINSLCLSGTPTHKLTLRKDSIVMLLRNLDPINGHCIGTRFVVQHLHQHVIDAVVACGPHAGKRLFTKIPLMPSDNIFVFHIRRKQHRLDLLLQ